MFRVGIFKLKLVCFWKLFRIKNNPLLEKIQENTKNYIYQ